MIPPEMLEHLQMLVATAVFNPALTIVLVGVWIFGRVLGGFMPWQSVVKPMVILYVIGFVLMIGMVRYGYDFYFLFGLPFIAGLWTGSKRRHA